MTTNEHRTTLSETSSRAGIGQRNALIVTVCFLIVLLDGLDTMSIGFVAPFLAREWNLPPAALTPAFIATSIGAVIGYMACGPLAQRLGNRMVGTGSVILFGLGTLLTAVATDITSLSLLRLVSAIGLGGAVPISIAASVQVVSPRRKEVTAMLVATGIGAGSVVGGLIGGPLIQAYGWESMFVLGGVLPLLLVPLYWHILSKQDNDRDRAKNPTNPVAELFRNGLSGDTILLWLFSFFIFVSSYALTFWIPTLLVSFGFDPVRAPLGAAAYGAGGLVGSFAMMTLVTRLGIRRVLIGTTMLAMICVAIISQVAISPNLVLPIIAGIGMGFITGCVGQGVLAISLYPSDLHATGVGWASALGRVGSIVGPGLGGLMVSFGWPARDIILTAILPAILAMLTLIALGTRRRGKA